MSTPDETVDKTGSEHINDMVSETALRPYYENDPATLTREGLKAFVEAQRLNRALFIKEKKR
jgi:hypothetical protein